MVYIMDGSKPEQTMQTWNLMLNAYWRIVLRLATNMVQNSAEGSISIFAGLGPTRGGRGPGSADTQPVVCGAALGGAGWRGSVSGVQSGEALRPVHWIVDTPSGLSLLTAASWR